MSDRFTQTPIISALKVFYPSKWTTGDNCEFNSDLETQVKHVQNILSKNEYNFDVCIAVWFGLSH